jgi:hypothetical protein
LLISGHISRSVSTWILTRFIYLLGMPARNKTKKLKSLSHKVEHLRLELEDREEALRTLEQEFMTELSKFEVEDIEPPKATEDKPEAEHSFETIEFNLPPPEDAPEHPTTQKKAPTEDAKKLWRQIAAATHPDKTGNDPKKTELYKAAQAAMDDGATSSIVLLPSLGSIQEKPLSLRSRPWRRSPKSLKRRSRQWRARSCGCGVTQTRRSVQASLTCTWVPRESAERRRPKTWSGFLESFWRST